MKNDYVLRTHFFLVHPVDTCSFNQYSKLIYGLDWNSQLGRLTPSVLILFLILGKQEGGLFILRIARIADSG